MNASAPQPLTISDDLTRTKHAQALAGLIEGEVRFGAHDRMLYATDASLYQVEPIGVVIPRSQQDLAKIVEYCSANDLPMLPRGGGTSLAGQCVNHAVVIDVSNHLHALEWVHGETRTCHVQPGLTIDDLNDQLREHGLFFAPDPSTARRANIGGCIGNNAAGTRSIKYGRTSENVVAIDVLLADGRRMTFAAGAARSDTHDLQIPEKLKQRIAGQAHEVRALSERVVDIVDRHAELIRERFPKTLRRNAGYALDMILAQVDAFRAAGRDPIDNLDLAPLICGSEGTLAIVTGATLKLHPAPKTKSLAAIGLDSLDRAIELVPLLLELDPSVVELLDDLVLEMARRNREHAPSVDLMPQPRSGKPLAAVLYVEFLAERDDQDLTERIHQLRNVVAVNAPEATVASYESPVAIDRALSLRKAGEPLLHAIPGARKPLTFVEDNAVPVERLAEFVRRFRAIVASKGTRASFWAHASVGVLHVRPLLSLRDEDDRKAMEEIAVEVADLAQELGGVMSGEHGDGMARGPLLERYFGPELMGAFRELKALFDPKGLLNPGNIVKPGTIKSIHESTRTRPHGCDIKLNRVETYFDYSDEEGFDHAVELCNGAGVCRKKQGGTMCPSYMATLDERHSTRGRGNALRLAITGQSNPSPLGGEGGQVRAHGRGRERGEWTPSWNDPETLATLDLCLSCKACKTECPTNVDIARYKAEYLAQSFKSRGRVPFRVRAFSDVRRFNCLGARVAPLSNWAANFWPMRALANAMLNLDARRSLPPFARLGGHDRSSGRDLPSDAPTVLLFGDCFGLYNEPGITRATIRVMNAFGYRVELFDVGCCGRPHLSTGNLEGARRVIDRTSTKLLDAVERTKPDSVLVCEPSCLSSITDDWLKLRESPPRSGRGPGGGAGMGERTLLASLAALPESFLGALWDRHPRRPAFASHRGEVLLHGHCHQKALWGAESSADLLRRVVGGNSVRVLDSGCCGMAGSFGYTRDHFDLSMKIGELALFPAVRAMDEGDVLVAPGTSCRHQVLDGVGMKALHPIELVAQQLV